ncbi:MAG TPA: aspartate--tRNA(Asn) ligase [Acidimicrobiia bacterium]|nr:aspartate--tRNA(Asn) ligase [Acidimicrobiia bacterium]
MRIWSDELGEHVGERVVLKGWLHNHRPLKKVDFVILRDAHGVCQIVANDEAARAEVAQWVDETVFEVEGTPKANPQAPGGVELVDPEFRVISASTDLPPINLRVPELTEQLPFQLDHAAVSLRHPKRRAIFALGAASMGGMRRALDAEGFVEIQTPKMVASSTETGANVFRIDYFGERGYLAQSPQFYKQMMVGVFERVYEIGPVFRAEPHDTVRHLAEYVSLDVELGFIDDHFTVMGIVRLVIDGMVAEMQARCARELELLELTLPKVPAEIPHVFFRDAQEIVERETGEKGVVGEPDLAPAHERALGDWAKREHDSDFLFVTGYPMVKRPFYTHPDPARPEFSNSFDLLFRGLELITGGQRLHRYQDYLDALARQGQDPALLEGYLEAFRYGMPPHGGFAIGLERWLARLVEAPNVRETTLFPRDLNRITP